MVLKTSLSDLGFVELNKALEEEDQEDTDYLKKEYLVEIEIGHPVILKDAKGLKKHGLTKGMKGHANNVVSIPEEDQTIVFFMPDGVRQSFAISSDRLVVDEERLKNEGDVVH